jgi:hypothetical protein
MIITDPSLKPSDRYYIILSKQLAEDGFILKQKKFERPFEHGKQVIDISFISRAGLTYGVEIYYHIIFDKIEKTFKKLFGKHWTDWTVHDQLGISFHALYDKTTDTYTDKSLNEAASIFLSTIYPKVALLNARFETYEQLNVEYNQFPSRTIDIVPSNRKERRILMGLLLTKQYEPHKFEERKEEYLKMFEEFDPFQREQQRQDIYDGIKFLESISLTH